MTPSPDEQCRTVLAAQVGETYAQNLLPLASVREFPLGTVIIHDSSPVSSLFLILEGEVSVRMESGERSLLLGQLGQGNWLGEVSLLSGEALASSGVIAERAVRALEISHAVFIRLLSEQPALANALVRVFISGLAERIRASDAAIAQREGDLFVLQGGEKAAAARNLSKAVLQRLTGAAERRPV